MGSPRCSTSGPERRKERTTIVLTSSAPSVLQPRTRFARRHAGLHSALSDGEVLRALLRLLGDAQIGLGCFPTLGELLLRIFVADRAREDDVLSLLPVDGRRHLVLGGELNGIKHAQHLVEVSPGGHRVHQGELDLLVRPDNEHRAHRGVVRRSARLRIPGDRRRKHVVQLRNLEVRVADHRVVGRGTLRLLDVLRPLLVVLHRVHAQADDLRVALVEFGFDARHVAELGRAHRGEVLGVGEENHPLVADPLVEIDRTLGRLRGEVGRLVADTQSHWRPPLHVWTDNPNASRTFTPEGCCSMRKQAGYTRRIWFAQPVSVWTRRADTRVTGVARWPRGGTTFGRILVGNSVWPAERRRWWRDPSWLLSGTAPILLQGPQ